MKRPDKMESGIRLGCGAVAGLPIGFGISYFWYIDHTLLQNAIAAVAAALVCSIAALFFGDRFWEALSRLVPWI